MNSQSSVLAAEPSGSEEVEAAQATYSAQELT